MIGLAVYLNRKKLALAGAEDLSVLSAIVTAVGELGESTARLRKRRSLNVHLSVGGLTNRGGAVADEHLRWISLRPLRVGDRISVQIVRTDRPDQHSAAHSAAGDKQRSNARRRRLEAGMKKPTKPVAARRSTNAG